MRMKRNRWFRGIARYAAVLTRRINSSSRSTQVHTLILVSLGSLLPIAGYFPLETGCHIHLIDAHRPYNLDNLFGSGVNDGRGDDAGVSALYRNALRQDDGENEQEGQFGRIWVWTDGEDSRLTKVKTSWEKLEVSLPFDCIRTELIRSRSSTSPILTIALTIPHRQTQRQKRKTKGRKRRKRVPPQN